MATVRFGVVLFFLLCVVGCDGMPDDGIQFMRVTESQPITIDDFSTLVFTDPEGKEVKLADIMTEEYLVLVITRGWYGGVCFYCASQTSRWARRFDELELYNAQLAVIFPTESADEAVKIEELEKRIKKGQIPNEDIPYPILLDINLSSVDQLGIRSDLAKPSTYIIDREGRVRFAYVGESIADRPTVDSILKQLSQLGG
ncbi:peroxiredoxin family protein [Rhodopirellula sp.]|nr:redoxin domain-containing protein [Rubripirellula sp.]MDA7873583.1 peroxiredoxin family protein [Rhodopirellula sp.]MDB4557676.1 peroxiredoxin family protein [bacterium]MDB4621335.1 peroxiredoxin family protein [Rubripirellula sp.]MDB4770800.1 peroxiredoxin family protein [bacterium]